jgi:hypothetical protein
LEIDGNAAQYINRLNLTSVPFHEQLPDLLQERHGCGDVVSAALALVSGTFGEQLHAKDCVQNRLPRRGIQSWLAFVHAQIRARLLKAIRTDLDQFG